MEKPELFFERDTDWYDWLLNNHDQSQGVYLIFYKLELKVPTMRWEEAVKVALCFGWIDATVKSLGNGKRRQYFCPRNPKSAWSALKKNTLKNSLHNTLYNLVGFNLLLLLKTMAVGQH